VNRYQKSPVSRLRPFWILCVAILVLAIIGGYLSATWQGFNPQMVRVEGNAVVSTAEILRHAAIKRDRNIWLQNPNTIARRIETIPFIDRAWVHRLPPATIIITVRERTPYAIVRSSDKEALVDHDLRVLSIDASELKLPVIVLKKSLFVRPGIFLKNAQVMSLRKDDDALASGHIDIQQLAFDSYGQLVVKLPSGIRILLGDDTDIQKKIPLITPILTQLARGKPFSILDLRSASTPVVVYK